MSYCGRCGKWNGAIAAPAGTEPSWCTCPKDLTPVIAILGQQIDILEKQVKKLQEDLQKANTKLNEVNRAGAANSWDMVDDYIDTYLETCPIFEEVRQRRVDAGNVGKASTLIAYVKELRERLKNESL
jgi:hypothetical protein